MSKIMVIDSGLGALTFAQAIYNQKLAGEWIFCLDQANNPYGTKSKEELLLLAQQFCEYALKNNIKDIFIACNTLSANVYADLVKLYPSIKIKSVVDFTIAEINRHQYNNALLLATNATVNSHIYTQKIDKITELAVQELVSLIENMADDNEIISYLNQLLLNKSFDLLILGCTHFPIVKSLLIKNYACQCVDAINQMINYYCQRVSGAFNIKILTSGNPLLCQKQMAKFFNMNMEVGLWQK